MAVNPKIVSLWSDTQSKDKFVCSGWLLDSRHILTVRHGVESLETVFVALLDGVAERREATVLRLHPKRDAALLGLDAQLDFTIPAPGVLAKHQALQNRTVAVHAISPTLEVPSAQIFGNYAIGSYVEGDRSWVLAPENARGHSGGVVTCEGVVVGLVWARAGSDPHCYATSTHVLFTWIQKILPGVLRTETIPTHANAAEPSVSADPMPPKTVPTNGKVPKKKYAKPRAMVNGSRGRLTVQEVRHCHQGLISALKSAIRPTGLFPSRPTDATTSPTVSALCALALHEFDETQSVAQSVVGKLVAVSRNLAGDAGAWPAQSGPIPHTVGTAWPLFAVARVLPHLLGDAQLQQSISWLAKGARSPRSGWGFHRRQAPDSFPTAYALNALLAVQGCRQAAEFSREIKMDMQDAIREAQHFLLGAARGNRARGEIYWNGDSNVESEVCLATTTMLPRTGQGSRRPIEHDIAHACCQVVFGTDLRRTEDAQPEH